MGLPLPRHSRVMSTSVKAHSTNWRTAVVSPVGIPSGEVFATPTVGANQVVSPAWIATAEAVGAPALTVGSPAQTVALGP